MGHIRLYRHKLALVVTDILAFLVAFVTTVHLRFFALSKPLENLGWLKPEQDPWAPMLQALPVMLLIWLVTLSTSGAYRVEDRFGRLVEFGRVFRALLIMAGVLLSLHFFFRHFSYSRAFTLMFLPSTLAITFWARLLLRIGLRRVEGVEGQNRVLLVGATSVAERFAAEPTEDAVFVGVIDDDVPRGKRLVGGLAVLGGVRDLARIAKEQRVRSVIVTDSKMDDASQLEILDICIGENLEWQVVPSVFELMKDRFQQNIVAGVPVIGLRRSNIRGLNRILKRTFDVFGSLFLLIMLSPLMALVAALIKLTSKGPVFFTQQRIGENRRPFSFIKFRSMQTNCDDAIHREYTRKLITQNVAHQEDEEGALYKIKNDPRLIPVGAFIRRYSIDELPQLFNVLKGDMSLIGPRPPIPYEVEVYGHWHKRRFEGPPGITGLWQVSGRNRLTFEEMVKLDIDYLENWSFMRDMKILLMTVGVVLFDRAH